MTDKMKHSGRLLSLDVMRGITIAGMVLVNNAGNWYYVYAPLKHVRWNGMSPTDLVFPFFMFIMGVSVFLSMKKFDWRLTDRSVKKILWRSFLLCALGYGLNWLAHGFDLFAQLKDEAFGARLAHSFLDFANVRVPGVMQRLGIAYCFGALLGCLFRKPRQMLAAAGILLAGYWIILALGHGFSLSADNIVGRIDRALIGDARLLRASDSQGNMFAFDPEGLLSALGSIAQVLLGFYCGHLLLKNKEDRNKAVTGIFIFGTTILFAGLLLSYGCPINKRIWSPTFALASSGFAALLLALLVWAVDIRGRSKGTGFFEAFGINSLFLYMFSYVFGHLFETAGVTGFVFDSLSPLIGDYPASLAYSLLFVLFTWSVGYYLYRKSVYIKI